MKSVGIPNAQHCFCLSTMADDTHTRSLGVTSYAFSSRDNLTSL